MNEIELLQLGVLPGWDDAALDARFTVRRAFDAQSRAALIEGAGSRVRAVVTRGDLGADAALIEALPALEIIAVFGVGFDGVDLEAARARGVRVANTPDVLTGDVADLAVAMALSHSRAMIAAERWARSGAWARGEGFPLSRRLHGKRAGVLGLGRIGRAIARRLAAFEMEIAYSARSPKHDAPEWAFVADPVALAARSDFLFVALAASSASRHIVDRPVLDALGPEGVLINVSRGSNVDEEALIDALREGRLGGAALDVFENEPAIDPRLFELETLSIQPHLGSATIETRQAMGDLMLANLDAHFSGAPLPSAVI